ncbi:MAG TPA: hypothetical protein VNA19_17015 [Pyrinomonadaceae bacterium]|jgi:hypothetical protein|nr:hypothetical protein [Pyrinomonadaceae bacterium]
MKSKQAIEVFISYSQREKEEFLAGLIYELTIVARDSYEVGGEGLTNPQRVRRLNEVQHRVSSFLCALLCNDSKRFPDDVLVSLILEHPDDEALERELRAAFARIAAQRLTAV